MALKETSSRAMEPARPGSPTPLYRQVKEGIVQRIDEGEWPPGQKIPSENQLVRELGVSRMTVNRALRELSQENRLRRIAGVGTFVAEPPRHASLIELRDIAQEIRGQGGRHSARLVWLQREKLDDRLVDLFERAGEEAFHVTLVHSRDEVPIQIEDRFVAPALAPDFLDLDFTLTTPSEHLLRSIVPEEMEHVVSAVAPDATTCELLAIPATEPCLRLRRRTWSRGQVVTYAELTYPSTRYDLGARYSFDSSRSVVLRGDGAGGTSALRSPSPANDLAVPRDSIAHPRARMEKS